MAVMKTPGVYIVEKNAFPNSVVEVATAVPAFIGYTERADNRGKSLLNAPWRITSMAEFINYYGSPPTALFSIGKKGVKAAAAASGAAGDKKKADADKPKATKTPPAIEEDTAFTLSGNEYFLKREEQSEFFLYYSMMLFFQNGGGPCYIVSVGNYTKNIEAQKLTDGIERLIKEQEPTMVVVPDAVLLEQPDCISVQQAALAHCGNKMKSRVAILDIWNGFKERQDPDGDCIEMFRDALGINNLDYAAAYYPWVNTTIVQEQELNYNNIADDSLETLQDCLKQEINPQKLAADDMPAKMSQQMAAISDITKDWSAGNANLSAADIATSKMMLNKSLIAMSPLYGNILKEIRTKINLFPPSGAMAGVYTMIDNSRGVWKAPANVSLNSVVSPAVNISHGDQEDLNVTTQGKSINAIRTFIGEGTLVWGARTLDGNSLDWRYINVRRTMIMLEESIRLASKAYVFEANDANTWVTMKSMIRNFLTGIWKRGGLAGASPEDAFSVHVGLGETMTSEDILEGILRITVLVAVTRPAEFIEITFQQQMQKS